MASCEPSPRFPEPSKSSGTGVDEGNEVAEIAVDPGPSKSPETGAEGNDFGGEVIELEPAKGKDLQEVDKGVAEAIIDADADPDFEEPSQPEPEPLRSPGVSLMLEEEQPEWLSLPDAEEVEELRAQNSEEASPPQDVAAAEISANAWLGPEVEVTPAPKPNTLRARSLAAAALQRAKAAREPKGPEVKKSGRCWASRSRSSPAQAVEGTEKGARSQRTLTALSVGSKVGGVILHSTWLGAFVNIGAEIDGFIEVQDLPPQRKLSAGDFVTGLVVREVDLSAPRLLLSAVQAKVHEA